MGWEKKKLNLVHFLQFEYLNVSFLQDGVLGDILFWTIIFFIWVGKVNIIILWGVQKTQITNTFYFTFSQISYILQRKLCDRSENLSIVFSWIHLFWGSLGPVDWTNVRACDFISRKRCDAHCTTFFCNIALHQWTIK